MKQILLKLVRNYINSNHTFLIFGLVGMVVISCLGIIAELAGQSTLFAPDSYWFVYLIGSFFGLPFWAMREFVFSVNPAGPLPDIFRFLYFPMGLAFCIILDLVKVAIRRLRSNSGGSKI